MKRAVVHVWTCVFFTWCLQKTDGKAPDAHITCQYSEDCVLPCSFTRSSGEEIHWFRQDTLIYSQPPITNLPDKHFMGRISISAHELSLGNASLLLQRCDLNDRGHYKCQVRKGGKTEDSVVILKVEAPIRSVKLEITRLSGYEEVKCSTADVYPAPHVFWSTDPPTPTEMLKYTTRKMADQQGLYYLESKLKRLEHSNNLTYFCTVNSSSDAQSWTTSMTETVQNNVTLTPNVYFFSTWTEINSAEGQDMTIPCKSPWDLKEFTLTWSVTRADTSTVICTYDSSTQLISNFWKGTAWLEPERIQKGDGSLRLSRVQSLEHMGTYTCNISALQRSHVGLTRVNITSVRSEHETMKMTSSKPWWPSLLVAITLMITLSAIIIGIVKFLKKKAERKTTGSARFSKEVKVPVNSNDEVTEGSGLTSDQS